MKNHSTTEIDDDLDQLLRQMAEDTSRMNDFTGFMLTENPTPALRPINLVPLTATLDAKTSLTADKPHQRRAIQPSRSATRSDRELPGV
ncbi:hypothetical protein SDRG_11938 [Saprolegnia diclina VS20]|uniref:Uncharacterized protein n=1 Tax=Saprolegnia diclina (strain VS20) TaxID=1156394 RepID=T0Q6Y5_SAPDV|nr:hypothetical protein SDRG_11938 [Saprolegnia diclina VS20]EQC30361.1 hypothetical protein SDRG_11938 [Saprolegnia diclina VS20]|eukprot:XP_008616214.1 hypothetical protein SDRG_11938 [Saprolegnia diclina VS20]